MSVCTFFGHKECPKAIILALRVVLEDMILEQGVTRFYVGNQGQFDAYVRGVLRQLKKEYPFITYSVVLAYLPGKKREYEDYSDTIFPEELETVPRKFVIARRNDWMLKQADFVITYVKYTIGGAAQFAEKATRQGKTVYNLAHLPVDMIKDLLQNETE